MKDILVKNYKTLYTTTFFVMALQYINTVYTFQNIIVLHLALIIAQMLAETGLLWLILNITRENPKPETALKKAFKSCGWIVILNSVKYIVTFAILTVASLLSAIIGAVVGETIQAIALNILTELIYVLFLFTDLIYYDAPKRGPLLAIYDSMTTIRSNYFKVFFVYLILALPNIIFSIIGKSQVTIIINSIYLFLAYPIYGILLCKVYNRVQLKKGNINDSLTVVARALDEEKEQKK